MGRGHERGASVTRTGEGVIQTLISIEDEKNEKNKLRWNIEALEKRLGHPLRRQQ
jgi:hypothetical protein